MTVFLLYLLLHRLQQRLPTAIHLWGNYLVVFNDEGATIGSVNDIFPMMTSDYWALSDFNDIVKEPCPAFRSSTARIIQASSSRPDRWKDWSKYCRETGTLPSQRPAKNSPAYGLVKQVQCSTYLLVDGAEKVDDSACTWHGY